MCDRYEWLARVKPNSLHLELNAHACNYQSAAEWIDNNPRDFAETPAELIEGMKATDTIWSLQIYPDTPIGYYVWYGPTLDSVVDKARAASSASDAK